METYSQCWKQWCAVLSVWGEGRLFLRRLWRRSPSVPPRDGHYRSWRSLCCFWLLIRRAPLLSMAREKHSAAAHIRRLNWLTSPVCFILFFSLVFFCVLGLFAASCSVQCKQPKNKTLWTLEECYTRQSLRGKFGLWDTSFGPACPLDTPQDLKYGLSLVSADKH